MAVFWACLIATSNLQMCIPQFIVFSKGKFAIAALLGVVADSTPAVPAAASLPARQSSRKVLPHLSDVLANSR